MAGRTVAGRNVVGRRSDAVLSVACTGWSLARPAFHQEVHGRESRRSPQNVGVERPIAQCASPSIELPSVHNVFCV